MKHNFDLTIEVDFDCEPTQSQLNMYAAKVAHFLSNRVDLGEPRIDDQFRYAITKVLVVPPVLPSGHAAGGEM